MATDTSDEKHILTVLWRIKNFPLWERDCDGREIKSPDLRPEVLKKKKILLVLLRTGLCHEKRIMHFSFIRQSRFPINCEISFVGFHGLKFVISNVRNWRKKVLQVVIPSGVMEEIGINKSAFLPDKTLTLRCRFWKSVGNFSEVETISIQTLIETSTNSFVWPIQEFRALELNQEVITIVRFNVFNLSNTFLLKFSLKGDSLALAKACLELAPVSIYSIALRVHMMVSVSTKEEKLIKTVEMRPVEKSQKLAIPIITIGTREEVLRDENFLINDVLNLLCELPFKRAISVIDKHMYEFDNHKVKISTDECKSLLETSIQLRFDSSDTCLQGSDSSVSLGEDLLNLYGKENRADIVLRCGKFTFNVHKLVLCAQSTVFRTIFCSDIEHRIPNCFDVPDLNAQTLYTMLKFIYSGTVNCLDWESATMLYYAANQYQVQSLKHECHSFFRSIVNLKNASEILSLAYRHDDRELKSIVYDSGSVHYPEFMNSPE